MALSVASSESRDILRSGMLAGGRASVMRSPGCAADERSMHSPSSLHREPFARLEVEDFEVLGGNEELAGPRLADAFRVIERRLSVRDGGRHEFDKFLGPLFQLDCDLSEARQAGIAPRRGTRAGRLQT